ncbi:DinB family protein [Pseudoponticoccus marisrubri]|uniref:Damage-inducible protein DinB n=1 Tax=Pseudoponticoccus marisrubri TaxID=1685382 RepID=A0A0W7WMJ5_9RHOB|nr:DinB family protein [Pseudoponticoccus marisrubri]KUF11786.1 damage-inducible protein DinB [Pseudoponticoccus marisrubri]
MILSPEYCVTMARYNAWQNRQLKAAFATLDDAALRAERGAFFGSILGTASHLLWGDRVWLSRLAGTTLPEGGIGDSPALVTSRGDWEVGRFQTDAALLLWAEKLRAVDLAGQISWYSGVMGADVAKPIGLCIGHMFNHQAHHRGQIHAMLTAAGAEAPVSDLIFMPEDGPWL